MIENYFPFTQQEMVFAIAFVAAILSGIYISRKHKFRPLETLLLLLALTITYLLISNILDRNLKFTYDDLEDMANAADYLKSKGFSYNEAETFLMKTPGDSWQILKSARKASSLSEAMNKKQLKFIAKKVAETKYTKTPGHFRRILTLGTALYKELQKLPQLDGADDSVFERKADIIETQCKNLVDQMRKEGDVAKA